MSASHLLEQGLPEPGQLAACAVKSVKHGVSFDQLCRGDRAPSLSRPSPRRHLACLLFCAVGPVVEWSVIRYEYWYIVNPFRTAVPLKGQTSQISSTLSSKRDGGSKGINTESEDCCCI